MSRIGLVHKNVGWFGDKSRDAHNGLSSDGSFSSDSSLGVLWPELDWFESSTDGSVSSDFSLGVIWPELDCFECSSEGSVSSYENIT